MESGSFSTPKMLDLELIPERAIATKSWEIALGSPIGMIIRILKRNCREIKSVDLAYSEHESEFDDIFLDLTNDGLRLIFCAQSQRLRKIDIYDLSKCALRYGGLHVNSKSAVPSLAQIDSSFGATHPGEYDPKSNCFVLTFRGIAFSFDTDHEPESSTTVKKCSIFDGAEVGIAQAPKIPFRDNIHAELCDVGLDRHGRPNRLSFSLITELGVEGCSEFTRVVKFGDFSQDVQTEIGCPDNIHFKSEDKMKIHLGQHAGNHTDYFFNYFSLGVDLLFCGKTHQIKKFILHTNYPNHYDFSIYDRCEFRIPVGQSSLKPDLETEELVITPRTSWTDISDRLCEPISRPVNLRRTSSANNTNPWGSTHCYSFGNLIFEVISNQQIATVIIFQ